MICPSCSFLNSSEANICVRCEHVLSMDSSEEVVDVDKVLETNFSSKNNTKSAAVESLLTTSQLPLDNKEMLIINPVDKREERNFFVNKLVDRDLVKTKPTGMNQSVEMIINPKKLSLDESIENSDPVQKNISDPSNKTGFNQTIGSTPIKEDLLGSNPKKNQQPLLFPSKVQKVKIDISQPPLPFGTSENFHLSSWSDRIHGDLKSALVWERTIAGFIDVLFMISCCLIFSIIAVLIPDVDFSSTLPILGLGFTFLFIALAYLFLFTFLISRTLGMEYQGLVVVRFDGKALSVDDVGLRTLGYCISTGCFGLGLLWAIFDPEGLTWHDRISKTLVIRASKSFPKDFLEEN